MIRMQIQLTDDQLAAVHQTAEARGVSKAAVIRQLVDERLVADRDERWARALGVIGRYRSGKPNTTSIDHDAALDEAYGTW